MELSGYLTVPYGAQAKNLPLVVFPHGGPASRDDPGFDWWAQAMASRGYAVLQVNFRGSEGFGWILPERRLRRVGPQDADRSVGRGALSCAAEGVIDPSGCASWAPATAATRPGRGRHRHRRLPLRGLLRRRLRPEADGGWSKERSEASFRYWIRFMGAGDGKDQVLTDLSPAARGDKVSIPVLLIHGRDDRVVPLEQSKVMADALEKAGKPVEFVVLKGEDHWLSPRRDPHRDADLDRGLPGEAQPAELS
jgi:dipeptidyl aminopeptidase/acylaminoacyl peptidase